jgi:hypothetical protein
MSSADKKRGYPTAPGAGSPQTKQETLSHYFIRKCPQPSREKAKSKNGRTRRPPQYCDVRGGLKNGIVMRKSYSSLYCRCLYPSSGKSRKKLLEAKGG